jgi:DNA-binding transcriptional LysR family regulator
VRQSGLHPEVTVSFELVPGRAQADYLRDRLLHVGFGRDCAPNSDIVCRTVALEELYVAAREPLASRRGGRQSSRTYATAPWSCIPLRGPASPTTSSACAATRDSRR